MSGRPATEQARPAPEPGARIVGADGRAKAYRPLPEPLRRAAREAGLAAYANGRFFEAHELMEPAWMGSPDPAERDLDQGLIKLCAAYVHAERGNALGMHKNLVGARRRLAAVAGEHGDAGRRAAEAADVDVGRLLAGVEWALARLEALRAEAGTEIRAGESSKTYRGLLKRIPSPTIRPPARRPLLVARGAQDSG